MFAVAVAVRPRDAMHRSFYIYIFLVGCKSVSALKCVLLIYLYV